MPRIGILFAADPEPAWTQFRKAMTELGYAEGRTVVYDYRVGTGVRSTLDNLAQSLVDGKVDVIVAVLSPAIAAAKARTSTIPIVFNGGAVESGIASNVARPEGNLTGIFSPSTLLAGKAVQLFNEVRPITRGFGLLLNAADPFHVPLQRDVMATAQVAGLRAQAILIKTREELPQAFETMARSELDMVLVQPSL